MEKLRQLKNHLLSKIHFNLGKLKNQGLLYIDNIIDLIKKIDSQKEINPEDVNRRRILLKTISGFSSLTTGILLISYTFNLSKIKHVNFVSFGFVLTTFVISLFLFRLSKKHFIHLGSYILIILFFTGVFYGSFIWGASMPSSLLGFALVIIMSNVLLGSRIGILTALFSLISIIILGVHEINHPELVAWKSLGIKSNDLLVYFVLISLMSILSWLSNKETEKSLSRARNSEKELEEERNLLEIKIEERTKELKKVQGEKINELYRFSEFGRVSSGIFHDLMNPLTSVSLSVEKLCEQIEGKEQIKDMVERAISASRKMKNLLDLAKKQIKILNLESDFSIEDEIRQACDLWNYTARIKNISIIFNPEEKINLYGNNTKFHQTINNLISNAIDSFDDITDDRKKQIKISVHKDKKTIDIKISDNGSGIKQEIQEKIFEQFFTTKEDKGIGLGLYTARESIEKYFKGTIKLKSLINKGTEFTINIPIN